MYTFFNYLFLILAIQIAFVPRSVFLLLGQSGLHQLALINRKTQDQDVS